MRQPLGQGSATVSPTFSLPPFLPSSLPPFQRCAFPCSIDFDGPARPGEPLCSYSYKSLFLQPVSFHIDANPPGVSPLGLACFRSRFHESRVATGAFSWVCRL